MLLSNTDFVTQLVKTISAAFIFKLMYFHEFSFPCHEMKIHHHLVNMLVKNSTLILEVVTEQDKNSSEIEN